MIKTAQNYIGADVKQKVEILNYYNQHCFPLVPANRRYRIQLNDNWCAAFVSVIAHKVGFRADSFPFEVSAQKMLDRFVEFSRVHQSPVKGDLIFYDWNGNGVANHVGIIAAVKGDSLLVIEGNKQDTVGYRQVFVTSKMILDIVRIIPLSETDSGDDSSYIHQLALETIRGKFGTGSARQVALGELYQRVQQEVNRILESSEY